MMNTRTNYYTSDEQITAMQEELAHAHESAIREENTYRRKKLIRYISSMVSFSIIGLLLYVFIMVNTARANGEVPTVFGYQIYEIKSGSMDPTLPVNSLIVSRQVKENEQLAIGDIITFVHNDVTITHRIIDVINTDNMISYQTKGDNAENSIDPDLIPHAEVKAKFMTKLPFYLSTSDDNGGDAS